MNKKKYRFFYHYNKPLTQQLKKVMWSVHFRGVCYSTENINCLVDSNTKSNNKQTYAVMQGMASGIVIDSNTVIIYNDNN